MGDLVGDNHEPQEILRWLSQLPTFDQQDLIHAGWSDYYYTGAECFCHGSNVYNTERKTITDLLSDLDGVEEQLKIALDRHPDVHNRLIVEGVFEPAAKGLLVYSRYVGKTMMSAGILGQRAQTFKQVTNWLRQARKYWEVVQTSTMAASAETLCSLYLTDQEDEESHTTFKRMYKTSNYVSNPQANRIMGASGGVAIGPAKAEALAHEFGTAWAAVSAGLLVVPALSGGSGVERWCKVPGVGMKLAQEYLRGFGRTDV